MSSFRKPLVLHRPVAVNVSSNGYLSGQDSLETQVRVFIFIFVSPLGLRFFFPIPYSVRRKTEFSWVNGRKLFREAPCASKWIQIPRNIFSWETEDSVICVDDSHHFSLRNMDCNLIDYESLNVHKMPMIYKTAYFETSKYIS